MSSTRRHVTILIIGSGIAPKTFYHRQIYRFFLYSFYDILILNPHSNLPNFHLEQMILFA